MIEQSAAEVVTEDLQEPSSHRRQPGTATDSSHLSTYVSVSKVPNIENIEEAEILSSGT
jgi:hypothetical protein